jgi:hypothetical protein
MRTWQDNADEFGSIERGGGGWTMAVLVACSVGTGAARVSVETFAQRAQVTPQTVQNYLDAWPRAIANGAELPGLDTLSPDDVGTFPLPSRPFHGAAGYANTRKGGANSAPKVGRNPVSLATAIAAADPQVLAEALRRLDPEQVAELAEIATDTDTENRDAAVIANGGRTDRPAPVDSPLDGLAARLATIGEAEQLLTRARRRLLDLGPLTSTEADRIRVALLAVLDVAEGAHVGAQR